MGSFFNYNADLNSPSRLRWEDMQWLLAGHCPVMAGSVWPPQLESNTSRNNNKSSSVPLLETCTASGGITNLQRWRILFLFTEKYIGDKILGVKQSMTNMTYHLPPCGPIICTATSLHPPPTPVNIKTLHLLLTGNMELFKLDIRHGVLDNFIIMLQLHNSHPLDINIYAML